MAKKRNIKILSDVVVVPRKQRRLEEDTGEEEETSPAPAEQMVQYSLGDELQIPEVLHQDSAEDVIVIEEEEDDETVDGLEPIEEEQEHNAQIFPAEDDIELSEEFLRKLEIFKNGSAARGFKIPTKKFPSDNNDHLLACAFVSLDAPNSIFAAVGIDPYKEFDVVYRISDIRQKRFVQFKNIGLFIRAVKTARIHKRCNCEGINMEMLGSKMKFSGPRYSFILENRAIDLLTFSDIFLFKYAIGLENQFNDLQTEYLKVLQDMVVFNTFNTTMGIDEFLLKKCLNYTHTKIFQDMYTYYFTRFHYDLAVTTRFIKKHNKSII